MKYKGKQGNSYLFECEGDELELECLGDKMYNFKGFISLSTKLEVVVCGIVHYKDIQTAVSMMQILIDEGEV